MKICVQGAAFDTGNMGVRALAVGTVRCILHRYPEAEVFFLNYEKFSTVYTIKFPGRQVAIPLVNMRFSWRFWLRNNVAFLLFLTVLMKLLPFPALRRRWIAGNDCLRHLDESDLVVAISGGDSFSDIYALERLLYVSLPQILALWAGKRLILLPQTVGPFRGHFSRMIARYILRHALRVYTRDYRSLKDVEALLGSSVDQDRYKFCYDVGFVLDSIEPSHQEVVGLAVDKQRRSPLVGLNISGLLFMGGYTRNNAFGLRDDYRVLVTSLIDFLISKIGANVLIVPHVFGMQRDSESDSVVCEQVFATLEKKYEGRLGLVRGTYNQSEIKYLIGQCDFFVGSRMHACIAAISQLVPAVCIAYSDKFAGVMAAVGVEGLVADARKMDQEAILGIVEKAYDERALLRRQLERKMPKVRETVLSLFAGLSAPIQGAETGGAEGDPGALGGAGARAESGAEVEAAGTIKSDPDQVESPSARVDIRSTCDTQTNDGFREGN